MAQPEFARRTTSDIVASFSTHDEARQAIDFLADLSFPVEQVAVITGDLRVVEQVTERRGYGDAALDGAGSGAVTGALLGFILGLFTVIAPLTSGIVLALWGFIVGGIIGSFVGLAAHALSRGRRGDYRSVRGFDAGRYDLVASPVVADQVRRLLAERPRRRAA